MAVKYTIPYRSIDDTPWRVDISTAAWTAPAITVRGYGGNACTIEYDGGVDDPFDNPVVTSKANMQLINQGEVDMDELQGAGDRDFVVEVYRDSVLKWKGYLITDNIQQPFLSTPYVVQLSAIDGLNMLEGITYTHNNLQTQSLDIAVRAPLNFLRQVLFAQSNLGLMLPIRWYVGLENVETEDDPIAGLMTWSPYGEGIIAGEYVDGSGNIQYIYQNCRYILEGLVKCMKGARIFQADGAWNIFPPIDIIGGAFTYNECEATLDLPTITQHTVDINRTVVGSREPGGDYSFIREDALITVKPALSKVDVRYEADRSENILPNGGFDDWSLGTLLHWGFTNNPSGNSTVSQYESLTGQPGSAVDLRNPFDGSGSSRFGFNGTLPIDANLLFKRMTWGFTILPINGFPFYKTDDDTDPKNGEIAWESHPLRVRVSYYSEYRDGIKQTLYLNRWGYWQPDAPAGGWLSFVSVVLEANQEWAVAEFSGVPQFGDTLNVWWDELGPNNLPQVSWGYVVDSSTVGNLAAALAELATIVGNGATSTATTIRFPRPVESGVWYRRASATSGKDNLLPGNWIDVALNEAKIGDVIGVVFQGKGGNNEIIFPDPGKLDGTHTIDDGQLHIEFALLDGQRYVLDDVWVRVEENNDVYRASTGGRGNSQSITLGISSSFSGFMVSNLMRSYDQSNTDFLWSDGTVTASLTEHYARAVMRWRYKPSRIFNGIINTRTKDWSFLEIYAFSRLTGNYVPLRAGYNTELCEVNLIAMEGRSDGTGINIQHYASNNMPLSNYGG